MIRKILRRITGRDFVHGTSESFPKIEFNGTRPKIDMYCVCIYDLEIFVMMIMMMMELV